MPFSYEENPPEEPYAEHIEMTLDDAREAAAGVIAIPPHLRDHVSFIMNTFLELFGHWLDHPDCGAASFYEDEDDVTQTKVEALIGDPDKWARDRFNEWDPQKAADLKFAIDMFTMAGVAATEIMEALHEAIVRLE